MCASPRLSGWGTFFSHAVHRRSGAHTLPTDNAGRTLDYGLAVDVVDLVGPRNSRRDRSQKISGTLYGTYEAKAPFERRHLYRKRDIERAVTIIIEDGEATITVNGEPFAGNGQTGNVGVSKRFFASHRAR